MNLKKIVVLSGFAIVMMAATGKISFAEEAAVVPVDSEVVVSNQQVPSQKENDVQWAWGEVTNLDNQAKTITLKYLDYETDQEKELVLVVDEKATFENIKDFNELKLKDTLSIDYIVGADNKNIAKNISFEKPDVSSSTPVVENSQPVTDVSQPAIPSQTTVPDLAQPAVQSENPNDPSMAVNEAPIPVESSPVVESAPASAAQGQAQ